MKKYPVRPGTAVMLPKRKEEPAPKKTRRHVRPLLSPEDQIRKLKKQRRWLTVLAVILILALVTVAALHLGLRDKTELQPGQNYSAKETVASESLN